MVGYFLREEKGKGGKMNKKTYIIQNSRLYPPITNNPSELLSTILCSIPNLSLWSYESMRDLYTGVIELTIEYCKHEREFLTGPARGKFTRAINKFKNKLRFIPKDRNKMLFALYDTILSGEGFSRLRGYGISNQFGDKLRGNPEAQRISKVHA